MKWSRNRVGLNVYGSDPIDDHLIIGNLKLMFTALVIQHEKTARIQEAHIFILHYRAGHIESQLGSTTG